MWKVPTHPVIDAAEDPLWYRSAVFYEVLLKSFADSDADGMGDFAGLRQKLDYLAWLGIDCLWIPPFYASPMADGGYDVSDYCQIDPRYGTMEDFDDFVAYAHHKGLRIVTDLVFNHTSQEHEWFRQSVADPDGPYGDYYVWSDTDQKYQDARIIFIDTETSNWTFQPERGQYYWHRFFSHQPDLNFENPAVQGELLNVIRFWADKGVDGFRLDAIPYLFEAEGTNCENLPKTYQFIAQVRQMIQTEYPGRILIAEANQPPKEVVAYFGTEEKPQCHICFHFPIMPRIFAALREGNARHITTTMAETPDIPPNAQWGTFLRNHDELTLEMVSEDERAAMYRWYAPEPRMRSNVGIRRRLATLLGGSRRLVELAHTLLLSLPGSPFLYYGDEIGMGDNIWLSDRDGVRTPMQWDDSPGAGFSTADPSLFHLPLITTPGYDQHAINVAEAYSRPTSLLHWLRGSLRLRRQNPALGGGSLKLCVSSRPEVLAFVRECPTQKILCVFNLSKVPTCAKITLPELANASLREVRSGIEFPHFDQAGMVTLTLSRHGYYWLELEQQNPDAEG